MGGTDERKTKRKQRKGDKCIGGVGQVGSDRTEGTEIKSWTKSAEFLKGGLKQGKKFTLSDIAQRSMRDIAHEKNSNSTILASG